MADIFQQYESFIEAVCSEYGCMDMAEPLKQGVSALRESITEPTMWLRHSYKGARTRDIEGTPKFNEAWHEREPYTGSMAAMDVALSHPYLVQRIVREMESDGSYPELCEKYDCDDAFYSMDEKDVGELMEAEPVMFANVIRHSEAYEENDRTTLDFNHTVVNGWLVHNSDNAWDIWREGFKYGDDMGELAYSNAGSTKGKDHGDYLFAFPIDDAPSPTYRDGLKYGKASIVFIGTGNEFYHYGDQEDQVIFDRRQPKGCFIVSKMDYDNEDGWAEYWCVIGENERHPLYHDEDYDACLDWIERNGDRYLKAMRMWNKNTPGRQVPNERKWK